MATAYQPLQTIRDTFINCRSLNAKRKSAVELLQETKSLYVKSEAVLDNEQRLVKSAKCDTQCIPNNLKEEVRRRTPCTQRRSAKSCSEQLQVKLRRLLNGNSKENLADGQTWDVFDSKSCKNELNHFENFKTDFITDIQYQSLPDLSVSSKESISYIHRPYGKDMDSSKSDEEIDDEDSDSSEKKMTVSGADSSENVNTDSSEKSYGKPPSLVKSASTMGGSAGKVEERLSSWTLERHKELPRSKSYVDEHQVLTTAVQEQLPHDLDVFFQNLGLSSEQYSAITCYNSSRTSSPVFFSCGDSTDDGSYCSKAPRRWGGSGDTNEDSISAVEDRRDTGVSIVEANARIVKWLCQLSTNNTTNSGKDPKKITS